MAVIECVEDWHARKGSWEFKGSWWVSTYSRSFKIVTDNPIDDTFVICSYLSAPPPLGAGLTLGSVHPYDATAMLQSISPSSGADPYKWTAEVSYSNQIDPSWISKNPLLRPVILKLSYRKEKEALEQAWQDTLDNGNVSAVLTTVLNSAGQPYDPPLERDREVPQLTLTVNVSAATFNPFTTMAYRGAVNTDTYRGCAPGSLRVANIEVSEQLFENLVPYYTLTWTLELNIDFLGQGGLPGGWRATQVLDRGLYENVAQVRVPRNPARLKELRERLTLQEGYRDEWLRRLEEVNAEIQAQAPFFPFALQRRLAFVEARVEEWEMAIWMTNIEIEFLERDRVVQDLPPSLPYAAAKLAGATFHLRAIRDELGRPATQPVPLNGNGRKLPPGAAPVYQYWNLYGDRLMQFTGVLP